MIEARRRRRQPRRRAHRRQPALAEVGPTTCARAGCRTPRPRRRRSRTASGSRRSSPATASPVYGDHGADAAHRGRRQPRRRLLTEVTRDWQAAAAAGARGRRAGLHPAHRSGDGRPEPAAQAACGCCSGSGSAAGSATAQQYFPMISLRDWVGGVAHLAEHDDASGPFNLCCPETPTNAEFTQALGRARRPPDAHPGAGVRDPGRGRPGWPPSCSARINTVPQALDRRRLRVPRPGRHRRARGGPRSGVVDLRHPPARSSRVAARSGASRACSRGRTTRRP